MKFSSWHIRLCILLLFINLRASAQLNSSQIKAGLEKLQVTGSVLYIAAHPDDENTRLLAYLANERKVRTGYLSLTRGDGGQNLIGTEQAEELGLIRTQELLAARKIDGAEQFFTRANDFGFSKTSEETFKIWNKDRILGDVVWVIRKFRPDVIITRFPGDARAGHGQHAASSLLAQEAFKAAADPTRYPEQLNHVKPWQAKRIFWNTFNFGGNNTTSDDQLKMNVGIYNALLGKDYGEIAAESRSQHKSQGFGVAPQRGDAIEYFTLLGGEPAKSDLFDGVNLSWWRTDGSTAIEDIIKKINAEFNPAKPQQSLPLLLKLHSMISNLADGGLRMQKLKETDDLILAAAGIWCEAVATEPSFSPLDKVPVRINAISRCLETNLNVSNTESGSLAKLSLIANKLSSIETQLSAGSITQPYWLEEKHPAGEYIVKEQQNIGFPENANELKLTFSFDLNGQNIEVTRPVLYKYTDPVRGELYQDLRIAPPVTANLESSELLYTNNSPQNIRIALKAFKDNVSGELIPNLPKGWKAEPASIPFNFKLKGDEQSKEFKISPEPNAESGYFRPELKIDGELFDKSVKMISYPHIPAINYFPKAESNLIKLDLKTGGKKIGYLMGAGDKVPEALKLVGYDVTLLNENRIMNTDLSSFDAIITGVRLYNVEPRMKFMNTKLLQYVEKGGVLLVQYNVNQPLVMTPIGPYPFIVTRDRVTEEDAKVTIINPSHPVFNYPNKITEKDFEGWIQERGIYFLSGTDSHYECLLSMNDTGEKPQQGSLVVANYGKGRFVYTGLVFFRELPAGVPGAYRLFVNLITKPKK